ncbi:MAG: CheY-like chemotaxis protein [Nitrospinales bacterium]|jgi:CheY-like chemotaxis protein
MISHLPSVLVVEENSTFLELMETILEDEVDVVRACSPEEGIEIIRNNEPFSVIWSGHEFDNSKSNGRDFLRSCCEHSPLSARILNTYSLKEPELQSMVNTDEIHSYNHNDHVSVVVDPIASAIEIGVQNYHVNLFRKFIDLDGSNLEPQDFVEESSRLLNRLEDMPFKEDWCDLENRSLEVEKLFAYQNFLSGKVPLALKRQKDLLGQISTKQRTEIIGQLIERNMALILNQKEHLIRSNRIVEQNREKIRKANVHIYRIRKLVKDLKDEFGDGG